MEQIALSAGDDIRKRIYAVRGVQVMLDRDLADLYGVEVRTMNQMVKRNAERFPSAFMLRLTDEEWLFLRSQFVILEEGGRGKYSKYTPYAFTEQGVAMLSAVLRSKTAVRMSVQIIEAFVDMRRFLSVNAQIFSRLGALEIKQAATDQKLDCVFNAIESRELPPKQGIFFDGQVFDAHLFVSDLIKTARISIILIDNYADDTVLALLAKRKKGVAVRILTKAVSASFALDVRKCNEQYPLVSVHEFKNAHDRFLIIDEKDVYHFGASLKDLGKKWFAFSKMDIAAAVMLARMDWDV